MIRLSVIMACVFTSGATFAEDARELADEALSTLGSVTDTLTTDTLDATVLTFGGTQTPEAGLGPSEFDDAILDVRTGTGADGRAYQSTVDSVSQRPDIDLGDNALGLANDAVENADAALGGFFSADGGSCSAIFQDGSYDGLRLCNSILQRQVDVCEVWREISVDREDFWACEIAERDFTRRCNRDVSWECTGTTQSSCRRNRVRANRPFIWRRNSSVMQFALGETAPQSATTCTIHVERIVIDAYVGFDPSTLRVTEFTYNGFGQLRVNGRNIFTSRTNSLGDLNVRYNTTGGKDGFGDTGVVYAGATPLDLCLYEEETQTSGPFDLLPHVTWPQAGPSVISASHLPVIRMEEHEEIIIELVRALFNESPTSLKLEVGGACCSAITSVGGEAC